MKEINVIQKTVELKKYDFTSLPPQWQKICNESKMSALKAYAHYSKFRVGAAALLDNGTILNANNQENIAYPSGLCAERVVLFFANANYPNNKITAIAIYSPDATSLLTPCGACRQVMIEYEKKQEEDIKTLIVSEEHVYIMSCARDWLPFEFSESTLYNK